MNADAVMRELGGLTALARSLVHGDADADDLMQDAAVAAIEHPPATDRPVRPWLAAVLRNRRRMDRRAEVRRRAREAALAVVAEADAAEAPDTALDRARVLERLAAALVALDEPYRGTVVKRYLDEMSAAAIARADGVPAGTVRWRLKTGLERLRAALDDNTRRWRAVLAPLASGGIVKAKTSLVALIVAILLLAVGGLARWKLRDGDKPAAEPTAARPGAPALGPKVARGSGAGDDPAAEAPVRDPLPGQGRAKLEVVPAPGGIVAGRVINWSTGDGVVDAELTFSSDSGATTVRSRAEGVFELAPAEPGRFTLTAVAAPGFLPFAPELLHSNVHMELTRERAVRGITVFLFPAVDYHGRVVDGAGAPVAGARVRLLGTPTGEQAIDRLETEWTSDKKGVGSSRVDLQACKLEYSIVSPK